MQGVQTAICMLRCHAEFVEFKKSTYSEYAIVGRVLHGSNSGGLLDAESGDFGPHELRQAKGQQFDQVQVFTSCQPL